MGTQQHHLHVNREHRQHRRSTSLTYNKANQMATRDRLRRATSSYNYDAFGQRLKLKTGTTPFQVQMYDLDGHMLTETSAAATPVETDYVYMDGMPIAAIQPAAATISALHTDIIGTVQRATNASKTHCLDLQLQPLRRVHALPATITMNLRFPGMISDATGLNHWGFRDYSKTFGQGMEADPHRACGIVSGYPLATVNALSVCAQ